MERITYGTLESGGLNLFYREAGPKEAPTILLLHGFPSSSHMFRDLMPLLADDFHLVAPDYPGFGYSSAPPVTEFAYTFDGLADVMERFVEGLELGSFSLYMQDYGGPVGFRLAARHPEWIETLVIQNANAYEEGFTDVSRNLLEPSNRAGATEQPALDLSKLEGTKFQYQQGARDPEQDEPGRLDARPIWAGPPGQRAYPARLAGELPYQPGAVQPLARLFTRASAAYAGGVG